MRLLSLMPGIREATYFVGDFEPLVQQQMYQSFSSFQCRCATLVLVTQIILESNQLPPRFIKQHCCIMQSRKAWNKQQTEFLTNSKCQYNNINSIITRNIGILVSPSVLCISLSIFGDLRSSLIQLSASCGCATHCPTASCRGVR